MEGTLGPQQFGGDGKGKLDDHDFVQLSSSSGGALASNSHSEAVQALRKYLLRKMSSEDSSSGDKEPECPPEKVISVAESDGSKLYCSLVQRPVADEETQGSKKFSLAKHSSLDLDDSHFLPGGLRYLRTDLCIPVLWSKCSFCDDFFENEEQLRRHLRAAHFQYFLNYIQMRPLTSTKSLSDLPFSSALRISESSSNGSGSDSGDPGRGGATTTLANYFGAQSSSTQQKKSIQCDVCGKCFTTKWNCKQHMKGHLLNSGGGITSVFGIERSSSLEQPGSSSSSSLSTPSSSAF